MGVVLVIIIVGIVTAIRSYKDSEKREDEKYELKLLAKELWDDPTDENLHILYYQYLNPYYLLDRWLVHDELRRSVTEPWEKYNNLKKAQEGTLPNHVHVKIDGVYYNAAMHLFQPYDIDKEVDKARTELLNAIEHIYKLFINS